MKELPILFRGEMVKAILEGRKTQTRRLVKFPGKKDSKHQLLMHNDMQTVYPMPRFGFVFWSGDPGREFSDLAYRDSVDGLRCPYGQPGDRLWVRETWQKHNGLIYAADYSRELKKNSIIKWRPSIFMPRWASRITLEVVSVRVERVQDISLDDCLSEGIDDKVLAYPGVDRLTLRIMATDQLRHRFGILWDKINAARGFGWDANPWVWAVEFKKVGE